MGIACVAAAGLFVPFPETITTHGRIQMVGGACLLYAPATGRIQRVLVSPGQKVRQGDLLVEFTSPELESANFKAQSDVDLAKTKAERELADQQAGLSARIHQQQISMRLASTRIQRSIEELHAQETLFHEGLTSRLEVTRTSQLVDDARLALAQAKQKASELEAERERLSIEIRETRQTSEATLKSLGLQKSAMSVTAPCDGTIEWVGATPGLVQASTDLIRIQPINGTPEVLVALPTKALGRVRTGLNARICLDGFDPYETGWSKAQVAYVGRDPIASEEASRLWPDAPSGAFVRVILAPRQWAKVQPDPGLGLTAEIQLGNRSLFARLRQAIFRR